MEALLVIIGIESQQHHKREMKMFFALITASVLPSVAMRNCYFAKIK